MNHVQTEEWRQNVDEEDKIEMKDTNASLGPWRKQKCSWCLH